MTSTEKFVIDFLYSAENGERGREPGQSAIEVSRELLLRARRLAKGIREREAAKKR